MPDLDSTAKRRDEVDHDLLTFGEAGARLQQEVEAHRRLVENLQAQGAMEELEQARARLAALLDAAERNRRRPIRDAKFESFATREQQDQAQSD